MTEDDRVAAIAALQLLLSDRPDHDIQHVIGMAFPQFRLVYGYQIDNTKTLVWDAKNKLEQLYASVPT
jgi:hypothetical protein